jgi:chemosensory pili system protein ChpA (sensor histidine kinase/response regulator)
MATSLQAPAGSAIDIGVNDLGPLAWVLDELRKSLDSATKALRRYVRDAEIAKGSDLNAADASQLRIARQQLHQSVGALEMVGFAAPASMLRGMEGAVQKFVTKPELCTDAAASKVERASFALLGYLEALLIGKKPSAIELFSQYTEVQELAGASRVHPADLWAVPWQWKPVQDTGIAALVLDTDFRSRFDRSALSVVKSADLAACAELARLTAGLANQSALVVDANFRTFWRIAAGVFESLATGSLVADLHIKRTASRLLIQLATHIKGDLTVPDRLAQDLLFFCAQATPVGATPLLSEVRKVYELALHIPVDYSKSFYGQFDPSLLVQARKRIGQLKESWSSFTAGELSKAKPVQDQMSLLVDSISKLLPNAGQSLIAAMNDVVDSTARQQKPPEPALGMEVATAILYIEASFEDFDPEDKQQANRIAHLAKRVQSARSGSESQPLESWMEELYRRVSDRQTMGSVVGELKLILGELEKMMDAYFRDPQDKVLLSNVPGKFMQMRGVLTVLGLDQAAQAVSRMRDTVEQLMVTEIDVDRARETGTFDRLGNNLGALGLLIDMLSYQPVLAKKLFVYDDVEGELKPLMGRRLVPENVTPEAAQAGSLAAPSFNPDATLPMAAMTTMAAGVVAASSAASSAVASPASAPVIVDAAQVDPELLDIFLEEAREVVGHGLMATLALVAEPNNIGEMTTLRRAFHTLKGSSRMVGLNVFGEAAWSMEQAMNAWLADQKPVSKQLCELSTQALNAYQVWIEEIAQGGGKDRTALPFRSSADALRLHGQFIPIQIPTASVIETSALATITMPAIIEAPVSVTPDFSALNIEVQEDVALPEVFFDEPQPLPELALPELELPDWDAPSSMAVELQADALQAQVPVDLPEHIALEEPANVEVPSEIDFDFEFDAALSAVEAPLSSAVITAELGSSIEVDALAIEPAVLPVSEPEPEVLQTSNEDALITAEELFAFEQALMSMNIEPSANLTTETAANTFETSGQQESESIEIDLIDLEALQTLTQTPDLAPLAMPTPQAFSLQNVFEKAPDFSIAATEPVPLEPHTQPSILGDLGIDLGVEPPNKPVASHASLWGIGAAGFAGAAIVGVANAAPASSSLFQPLALASAALPATGAYAAEEQFKAIGPLRVSLPLYNVYLNEADEWSRRLVNVLSEWAMEPDANIPGDAVAFAHSLAGSSATVGFSTLSGLARSLENTLIHMQRIEDDGEYNSHSHAPLFVGAAEEIRHLLHQFAAGILKGSSPQIETELAHCMNAPFVATGGVLTDLTSISQVSLEEDKPLVFAQEPQVTSENIELDLSASVFELAHQPEPEPTTDPVVSTSSFVAPQVSQQDESFPEQVFEAPLEAAPVSNFIAPVVAAAAVMGAAFMATPVLAASLTQAPLLAVKSRQFAQDEMDDEIDAVDAIDPDLFEIFEEEAQELFPATASALRQWTARPDNMSARGEVLRGLHTLKGSARLAGAMRLGELAHRMESSVENIPHEGAEAHDIDQLMAQLDGMQHNFDVLRNPALANEPTQPLAAAEALESVNEISIARSNAPLTTAPSPSLRPVAAATGMVAPAAIRSAPGQTVRVRAQLLDRLMNQAGEVMITRARLEAELSQLRGSLTDLGGNLDKLRAQLRELDVQAESQMQTRLQQTKETEASFDPLEFDRYTRVQELTRMMAESVNDVATVQRNIQRTIESTEDDLVMQARQTRDLQRDLLRTRMVEFEGISERLYRVVRQAGKDAGKQVKLDILGGTIEMDRGVLDRMTPAFEHLLRNCVAHGIETAEARVGAGKAASGEIVITLHQEGNDVSIEFRDDGAGLNIARIREKAISQGLLGHDAALADSDAANLIFTPGFSTATAVTELSGRGVGMDVVRSEVVALGGRIETSTSQGQGTSFKLVLPLTTAVTQVVMMRIGSLAIGIPANLIEIVRRATLKELQSAYNSGTYDYAGTSLPFFWAGALLQHSSASSEPVTKTMPIAVFRSAAQRVVMHIDEILGNQEVVVKNLGPQLSRLPGLAGMTVLASGAVALIYNPVALATVYGAQARAMSFDPAQPHALEGQAQLRDVTDAVPRELSGDAQPVMPLVPANPASISPPSIPLVLVVDDSITVRRVTQRLLQREGYRVTMAADGLQALERLAEELPSVILSDIEMPRMDGFDLLRNVRGDVKLKHLPTIMITSRIAEKHREYAFELGANHYLGKPYNEEELLSLIRRYAREEATV